MDNKERKIQERRKVFSRAGLLDSRECYPLLEGISTLHYDVEKTNAKNSSSNTDNKNRVVRVPLDDSDKSRRIRVHEMSHAVISPEEQWRPENIDKVVMQRAEDMRCNLWNSDVGHSELNVNLVEKNLAADIPKIIKKGTDEDKLHMAAAAFATKGTADYDTVIEGIKKGDKKFGKLVEKFCDARYEVGQRHADKKPAYYRDNFAGSYEESIVNAEMLMELVKNQKMPEDAYSDGEPQDGDGDEDNADAKMEKVGKGEYDDRKRGGKVVDAENVDESAFGWSAADERQDDDDSPQKGDQDYDPNIEEPIKEMMDAIYPDTGEPGIMTVVEPSRRYRLAGSMEGRTRKPADIGRVPMHMDRFATDKYIFTEPGKRPGGCTVLIDDSGSMALRIDDIEWILSMLPAARIGAYSGNGNGGNMIILAHNGRRITQEDYKRNKSGPSNCIDVPSLEWLCKQPGPRYWVSDGYVTGKGDSGLKPVYFDYIKRLSRKYKIYRIPCLYQDRLEQYNRNGHEHLFSLEGVVSGGKRRRKIKHSSKMIGSFMQYDG